MKKQLFFVMILSAFAGATFGQVKDRVRISYIGFNCNSETADNALELDGKGDEIFIQCNWLMADKNNNLEFQGKYRSPIHGDINHHYGWIKAGSRSENGGIRSGDQFRGNTAFGEFEISDGELLTLLPTIWEWDGNQGENNAYMGFVTDHAGDIKERARQLSRSFNPAMSLVNPGQCLLDFGRSNMALFSFAVDQLFGQAMDRPIGMTASGQFSPKSFVLTRDQIRQIAQRNMGYGPGVLQLDYDENQLGNSRCHGAYSILLKAEFLSTSGNAVPTTVSLPVVAAPGDGRAGAAPLPAAGQKSNVDGNARTQVAGTKAIAPPKPTAPQVPKTGTVPRGRQPLDSEVVRGRRIQNQRTSL